MEYKIHILISLILWVNLYSKELPINTIAYKIYKNECNLKKENLVYWSDQENFPSLGIGHFIWYPKGVKKPFLESFPKLIKYFEDNGVKLPSWLNHKTAAPWRDKQEMLTSPKRLQLQKLLLNNMDLQALFIQKKIKEILPKLLQATPKQQKRHVKKMFNNLSKTTMGAYILTDYLNFKGSGTNPKERYKNQGWGLLQVLLCMKNNPNPNVEFAKCAKIILLRRVKNAPSSTKEEHWIKGWFNRIDTYTK